MSDYENEDEMSRNSMGQPKELKKCRGLTYKVRLHLMLKVVSARVLGLNLGKIHFANPTHNTKCEHTFCHKKTIRTQHLTIFTNFRTGSKRIQYLKIKVDDVI